MSWLFIFLVALVIQYGMTMAILIQEFRYEVTQKRLSEMLKKYPALQELAQEAQT